MSVSNPLYPSRDQGLQSFRGRGTAVTDFYGRGELCGTLPSFLVVRVVLYRGYTWSRTGVCEIRTLCGVDVSTVFSLYRWEAVEPPWISELRDCTWVLSRTVVRLPDTG